MQTRAPDLAALVLAAGAARRFGSAKQLLPMDGQPLLGVMLKRAADVVGERLWVVLGARAQEIEAGLTDAPGHRIHHPGWQEGIGSSLRAGVQALPADCSAVLILLADQAAVSVQDLLLLVDTWQRDPARLVAARYAAEDGVPHTGVPAIFPRPYFPELLQLAGDTGARALLSRHKEQVQAVPMPSAALDIDTPADAERLKHLTG